MSVKVIDFALAERRAGQTSSFIDAMLELKFEGTRIRGKFMVHKTSIQPAGGEFEMRYPPT